MKRIRWPVFDPHFFFKTVWFKSTKHQPLAPASLVGRNLKRLASKNHIASILSQLNPMKFQIMPVHFISLLPMSMLIITIGSYRRKSVNVMVTWNSINVLLVVRDVVQASGVHPRTFDFWWIRRRCWHWQVRSSVTLYVDIIASQCLIEFGLDIHNYWYRF